MLMPILLKRSGFGPTGFAVLLVAVLGFGLAIATPTVAGEFYSWETADGNVAFTDNPKNIPARYRDQLRVRKFGGIEDYARFTSQDSAEAVRYSDQLAKRIEYLRGLNSDRDVAPAAAESARVASVRIAGIDLQFPTAGTSAPIIVEKLRVKSSGEIATRHDTIVSQSGKALAIVRGNQRGEVDGAVNIFNEKDLEFYR